MTELVKLKKGDKIITRTKFDYEKNFIHWQLRGFELVENSSVKEESFEENIIEDKPKRTRRKKEY